MNLIIQTIIGSEAELNTQGRLNAQTRDSVHLKWYEAERRILRTTTEGGRDIAFKLLKEGQRLHHGDVVYLSDTLGKEQDGLPKSRPRSGLIQASTISKSITTKKTVTIST